MPIEIIISNNAEYVVRPLLNDDIYLLSEGDKIVFTVKISTRTGKPLIKKVLTIADYVECGDTNGYKLIFVPADTCKLSGGVTYKYDCCLELSGGERYTFIPPDDFIVRPAVNKGGGLLGY